MEKIVEKKCCVDELSKTNSCIYKDLSLKSVTETITWWIKESCNRKERSFQDTAKNFYTWNDIIFWRDILSRVITTIIYSNRNAGIDDRASSPKDDREIWSSYKLNENEIQWMSE